MILRAVTLYKEKLSGKTKLVWDGLQTMRVKVNMGRSKVVRLAHQREMNNFE